MIRRCMGSVHLLSCRRLVRVGSSFHALSPSRVVDTRLAPLSAVVRGGQLDVALLGPVGCRVGCVGGGLNVTAVDGVSSGM